MVFASFFTDLDTNCTLEARLSMSYVVDGLQMLIMSDVSALKTPNCLEELKITGYLSTYAVLYVFDMSELSKCNLVDPVEVSTQVSMTG